MIDKHITSAVLNAAINSVNPLQLTISNFSADEEYIYICGQTIKKTEVTRIIVIAVGKAAAPMAKAAETILGKLITSGICVTKYGHLLPLKYINTTEAGHPIPDENSVRAAKAVLKMVQNLKKSDIVLILLSGGASALLTDIPENCSLYEIRHLSELLINSGAGIKETNVVRKHISKLKGGQLAKAAYPAKIFSLLISDIPGDDMGSIGSGPALPDPSTFYDAYNVLLKYDLWKKTGAGIKEYILKGISGNAEETPKPGNILFTNIYSEIIGSNRLALHAAKKKAGYSGYDTIVLNSSLTGNTEEAARNFIKHILNCKIIRATCFLLGGETTLKVTGYGKGGRNQHFVLCALDELLKHQHGLQRHITLFSAGTDGTDGTTDATGAIIDSNMLESGMVDIVDLQKCIRNFDAYPFFEKHDALIKTGPTLTNVMDIAAAFIQNIK